MSVPKSCELAHLSNYIIVIIEAMSPENCKVGLKLDCLATETT